MGDWGMARLFVAVRPPPEVMALLAAIDRPALPGVRWSVPEQWLVKLRPVGMSQAPGGRCHRSAVCSWRPTTRGGWP